MVLVWRIAELLLLIIAVIAVVVFIALSRESFAAGLPALFIAISSSVGVYITDKRIKKLTEPKPITIPTDFQSPFRVYISKKKLLWLTGLVVMFIAPVSFMYEEGAYGLAIGSGLFGLMSFLMLLRDLKKFDTPYLILDSQAITTHEYGRIPWGEVDNASLYVPEHRGRKHYLLGLSVYDLPKYRQRLALFQRLKRWLDVQPAQDDLRITLNMLSHEPRYIEAVVKHFRALYARSVGITPITGDLSKDKKLSEIDRLMNSLRSENSIEKLESATTKVDALNKEVDQEFRDDFVRIRKAIFKNSTYVGLGLVLIVLITAYKFLDR